MSLDKIIAFGRFTVASEVATCFAETVSRPRAPKPPVPKP